MPTTAVQIGIGPIGSRLVEVAAARGLAFVGAVDVDPEKVGRDLGDVAGLDRSLGVEVTDDLETALAAEPDVALHATASSLAVVEDGLADLLAAGVDVVSTTEELAYPWREHADAAERLDAVAREGGATCLGTGINPGFAMDVLPAVLTAPCRAVDRVRVERVQDAGTRRGPLQAKVGAGLSPEAWERDVAGAAGHVGLPESVGLVAHALGWSLEAVEETIEPVVAAVATTTEHATVEPGDVAGIHQVAVGTVDGRPAIELDLGMYVGAPDPRDVVTVVGEPDVRVRVDGGFHGDVATPAVVVNAVPRVREAAPGLATMVDLATPRFAAQ